VRQLAFFLALVPALAAAQPTGLYAVGALARSQYDADAIGQFNETYSDFYAQRLDGPVTLVPDALSSLTVGGLARVNLGAVTFGFSYTLSRERDENVSQFDNGAGDRIATRTQTHAATTEITTGALRPLVLGASFGGLFRGVRVASATVYPDGSESYGSEYRLNGIYTASAAYFEAGLVAGVAVGDRVVVPVRVFLPLNLLANDIALTDYDTQQFNNYFPRDFDRFVADPTGEAESEAAMIDAAFIGPRVQVGVEVRLF
jgi:hypothetical protein